MRTMRGHTCLLLGLALMIQTPRVMCPKDPEGMRYQYPLVLKMMPFAVLLANENGRHVQGFMGHAASCLNLF